MSSVILIILIIIIIYILIGKKEGFRSCCWAFEKGPSRKDGGGCGKNCSLLFPKNISSLNPFAYPSSTSLNI